MQESKNTKKDDKSTKQDNNAEDYREYSISEEKYQDKNITIEYPKINGFQSEQNQTKVNEYIKNEAIKIVNQTQQTVSNLEVTYEIKYQSQDFISIAYNGYAILEGAVYPQNLFYTTNIDLNKIQTMKLSDIINLNAQFVNILKNNKITYQNQDQKEILDDVINNDDLMSQLENSRNTTFVLGEEPGIYCFFTNKTIGICFPVIHAAGDYAVIEINKNDLDANSLKLDIK